VKQLTVSVSDNVFDELKNIGGTFEQTPEKAASLLLTTGVTKHYEDESITAAEFLRDIIRRAREVIAEDFEEDETDEDGLLRQITSVCEILDEAF